MSVVVRLCPRPKRLMSELAKRGQIERDTLDIRRLELLSVWREVGTLTDTNRFGTRTPTDTNGFELQRRGAEYSLLRRAILRLCQCDFFCVRVPNS